MRCTDLILQSANPCHYALSVTGKEKRKKPSSNLEMRLEIHKLKCDYVTIISNIKAVSLHWKFLMREL